jgi:hypothetical protein
MDNLLLPGPGRLMFNRLLVASFLSAVGPVLAANAEECPRAVVELFTSQGCSSCPAADKIAGDLAEDDTLVVLSFPVTYWDYLGWKDTLARPEFTERQRAYAAERRDRAVYTPQMIVNGREHVIGSDRSALDRAIHRQTEAGRTPEVPVAMTLENDGITARGGGAPTGMGAAILWLVQFDRKDQVEIKRGENRDRVMTYTNVVRQIQPIGRWKGQEMTVDLPANDLLKNGNRGIALLLQAEAEGRPGAILGAAVLHAKPAI